MSRVTGVMLICGLSEDAAITDIQEWLADRRGQQLNEISNHAGGAKHPGFMAWCGGINHLETDEDEFAEFFLSRTWDSPQWAVMVLQPEERSTRVFRPNRAMLAPFYNTPEGIGSALFDFLNGTSNAYEWHYFTNTPLEDEELESIRVRAKAVASEPPSSDLDTIRALLDEVETIRIRRGD